MKNNKEESRNKKGNDIPAPEKLLKVPEDTSILILSCDKYSDAWEPFFFFLFYFWPDCPFPVFLLANQLTFPDGRVTTLHAPLDLKDWSSECLFALDRIPTANVILLLEDYFLSAPVQEETVVHLIQYAHSRNAGYLRLVPIPPPDLPCDDNLLVGEILPGSLYRTSTQAAWWNKNTLRQVLRAGESPWEFEKNSSKRSAHLTELFLSLREGEGYPFDYYTTAIRKGLWEPGALEMCKQYGIHVDLKRRKVLTRYDNWIREINAKVKHPLKQLYRRMVGKS
jgi:hypothetical protein